MIAFFNGKRNGVEIAGIAGYDTESKVDVEAEAAVVIALQTVQKAKHVKRPSTAIFIRIFSNRAF